MKHFTIHPIVSRIAILCLLFISLNSCNQNTQAEQKPWWHQDVMPQKLRWFLNSSNYTDSNYIERFQTYYSNYLAEGHADSALFCLLVYGEMIDQNYLYDTLYLNTAIQHLNRFEPISIENGELIKLYYYIGSQYEANSDYNLAQEWFKKGIEHPKALPKTKIKCMGMLSQVYRALNQHEKALPLQLERLAFYEKEMDTVNIGVTYSNIAGIYNTLNADQLALEYEIKAIQCARAKNDSNTLIPFLSNYLIYTKNGQTDFKITEDIIQHLQELNAACASFSRLSPYNEWVRLDINCDIFAKQNKLDSLKLMIDQMNELNEILQNPSFKNKTQFQESIYREKAGLALPNEKELNQLAKDYEYQEMWAEARRTNIALYTAQKKRGDYKSALEHYERIYDIEMKRVELNNKGQIYEMDIKYQTEKKNQEIIIQAEQLKTKQRNIVLLLASLVIIALSFLAYYLWQKKKTISEKRKSESQFTQKLMENTEDERMRIAKDLHDSVGHELLSMKNALSNKLQFTEEKIDHILAEVREISRNLFPVMFEEIGLKISVEQLAESIFNTDNLYVSHDVNYIAGTLDVKSELQIYRIIQEALNNTRKYAQAKSAKISIQQTKNFITVEIKDNGKGFDVMEVLKSGKAFGLLAINQRSKALQASVATESNSKGTTISLEIPIKNV
jgi:two-component system, NarL family, sensor kinase